LKFEGPYGVIEALRAGRGAALVIVPLEFLNQLTGRPELETRVIGDNGMSALVFVRLK
jgi:hypothetical protein